MSQIGHIPSIFKFHYVLDYVTQKLHFFYYMKEKKEGREERIKRKSQQRKFAF